MRGTIERYGKGWRYRAEVGRDPATGRRKFVSKGGFATQGEARRALNKKLVEIDDGTHVERRRITVADYLDEWFEGAEHDLRPTSAAGYRRAIVKLKATLGHRQLQELTPAMVEASYRQHRKDGLAPKTILNTHSVLRKALNDAERLGLVQRNVARSAKRPKVLRAEQATWSADQLSEFLNSIRDDPYFGVYLTAATTGLRRGELLGLGWPAVDLDSGSLSVVRTRTMASSKEVEGETKTDRSRRRISLDPMTVEMLRRLHRDQLEQRKVAGPAWIETGLVFTDAIGRGVSPDAVSQHFAILVKRSSLPYVRLHDLRHTHATLALKAGVHPKVVSERLGHAGIGITLDLYSHVSPGMDRDAANAVAGQLSIDL
ncbi:MAG: site-specific integrase [Acidimicrobiales bacterium]